MTYVRRIRRERDLDREVPAFDPCDGGTTARILVLLEAPGPRAVCSSFVSRNNPDQTAKNVNELLRKAGIPRQDTIIWNVVPWYIGYGDRIRKATREDIVVALPYLRGVIKRLRNLRAIVLLGDAAKKAGAEIGWPCEIKMFHAPHPSPQAFNRYPAKKKEALRVFRNLMRSLK